MGDRANVAFYYAGREEPIYFYTHWGGSELVETVRRALKRGRNRWTDEAYLARIVFSEMIQNEVLQETGYGIAPYECDTGPVVEIRPERQTVALRGKWVKEIGQFVAEEGAL